MALPSFVLLCPLHHPLPIHPPACSCSLTGHTHLSTLPPTIAHPSAQPPGCPANSCLPVFPAAHLICEPYVPLTCGLSQALSTCLPPNGTLLAPHGLPASLTLPPCHLHVTSCDPAPFLSHPAALGLLCCMCPPPHEPPWLSYAVLMPH